MRWGLIGGGRGSQIGEAHRIAARLDDLFVFSAGALDVDAAAGRAFGRELGLAADRSYGDWREMLKAESARPDGERLDLVTVATPNATHYEITKAFLEAGFNVLCEKPLTMNVEEADDLCATAASTGKVCAVNFGYSGYPMAIEARAMIAAGELGDIRVVMAEFAHGAHADANDAENPRVRWRYDPAQAGISSVVADIGVHVLQMAQFMTGQKVASLTAQFDHCVSGRELEDDALLSCRFDKGAVGRRLAERGGDRAAARVRRPRLRLERRAPLEPGTPRPAPLHAAGRIDADHPARRRTAPGLCRGVPAYGRPFRRHAGRLRQYLPGHPCPHRGRWRRRRGAGLSRRERRGGDGAGRARRRALGQ